MSYYRIFEDLDAERFPKQLETLLPRAECLAHIKARPRFDIVVIGGGIHGATFARLAAFNGVRVLLLERGDYAQQTSSRSSKMAHGGLRYLELFDFRQVFEGVKAREDVFSTAAHLVHPSPFLVPVPRNAPFQRVKLKIGLSLYDLFVKRHERRHRWRASSMLSSDRFRGWREQLSGCYEYQDGLMNDARLVWENIHAARREGAYCFNYAEVTDLRPSIGAESAVSWRDGISGNTFDVRAGIVVNCAGPWVADVAQLAGASLSSRIVFSRGSHLIFNVPWDEPSLCLPLGGRGRYYFVWPHEEGTMVGTTESPVNAAIVDPLPSVSELQELMARVQRDLPNSGLSEESVVDCFAGIRALPARGRIGSTVKLSRRHSWHFERGVLSLLGGKFTTAAWTAYEGLSQIFSLAGLGRRPTSLAGRPFVGAIELEEYAERFLESAQRAGVPRPVAHGVLRRRGARVDEILGRDRELALVGGCRLCAEVSLALDGEQVHHFQDLARRLEFTLQESRKEGFIDSMVTYATALDPTTDWRSSAAQYVQLVDSKRAILEQAFPPS